MNKNHMITEIFLYDLKWHKFSRINKSAIFRRRYIILFFGLVWILVGLMSYLIDLANENYFNLLLIFYGIFEVIFSLFLIRKLNQRKLNQDKFPVSKLTSSDLEKLLNNAKINYKNIKDFSATRIASSYADLIVFPVIFLNIFNNEFSFDNTWKIQLVEIIKQYGHGLFIFILYLTSALASVFSGNKSPKSIDKLFHTEKYKVSFQYLSSISNSFLNPKLKI